MIYYAGLDVSLEETSVCVVDEKGHVVQETKVASEWEAIAKVLQPIAASLARVGLEAGPLSPWLSDGLRVAGFAAICIETRHLKASLGAMRNKTDRNDARGIAQMMRLSWFRAVHVKSAESHRLRLLLSNRKTLQRKAIDIENEIRGTLKAFGLKIGKVSKRLFEMRVWELLAEDPRLSDLVRSMLKVRAVLLAEFDRLHKMVLHIVRKDPQCRRFMTIPGVGPITALTYKTAVEVPERFTRSKNVGAHFGLTPRKFKSGEVDYDGRISKCGDEAVRTALYEAANVLLTRSTRWSALKAWAMRVARDRGLNRARVALARKLALIMHRMWLDGSTFCWSNEAKAQA